MDVEALRKPVEFMEEADLVELELDETSRRVRPVRERKSAPGEALDGAARPASPAQTREAESLAIVPPIEAMPRPDPHVATA